MPGYRDDPVLVMNLMEKHPSVHLSAYRALLWVALAICTFVLIRLLPTLTKPELFPSDDFVQSWAGGKLNFEGQNPFDPALIEREQIRAGGQPSGNYAISIMLNPPWAIALVMPFGWLPYPISRLLWLVLSILFILVSSLLLWRKYSEHPQKRWVAILLAFTFGPAISVLEVGQITPFVLLGLCGFLYFSSDHKMDWLAGACLALASIKPQLALLFWVALLFWIIHQRRWPILFSAALSVCSLLLITWIFNPHILQQYIGMLQSYRVSEWANPTIGAYLRFFIFGVDHFWLQFLPVGIALIGFLFYWRTNKSSWDWTRHFPLLLLVSIVTSPYMWTYDQIILLPAIIQAAVWLFSLAKPGLTFGITVTYIAINILDLILHRQWSDFWFLWLAPAFLILFLLIQWQYSETKPIGALTRSQSG